MKKKNLALRNTLITLFVSFVSALTTAQLLKDEQFNSLNFSMLYLLIWIVVFICFKFILLDSERELK